MKEPRPLLMETDSDELKALLRSAELDEPPDGAKRRVLGRVGVGVGVTAAVMTATTGSAATSTGVLSAAKLAPLAVGKWIAIAAVVSVGTVAAVHRVKPAMLARFTEHPPSTNAATSEAPAAREGRSVEPVPIAETTPEPASESPATPLPPARNPRASSSGKSDIDGEIAAVEQARSALNRGNSSAALAAIDRYSQRYPRGMLAPEAMVIRIEALQMAGDKERAKSLGDAFLRVHPKSPHAQRVRSLIGAGQ